MGSLKLFYEIKNTRALNSRAGYTGHRKNASLERRRGSGDFHIVSLVSNFLSECVLIDLATTASQLFTSSKLLLPD